jgi:hypothetical protein
MVLADLFATASDLQRYRFEAEAAANLDHPNELVDMDRSLVG